MDLPDGLTPLGPPPAPRLGEILAVLTTRNEALRLPDCLRHLFGLGVDRVVVIDNLSSDGTVAIARAAGPRVHVITAPGSYAGSNFGVAWVNALLDACARGHWVFVGDADELLVFPGSDSGAGLRALTAHLDALGAEAFRTLLLDCFPDRPLRDLEFASGDAMLATAPFFEMPRIQREAVPDFPYEVEYGGIRQRLFFPETLPGRPLRWLHQRAYNALWRIPALRRRGWFRARAPHRPPALTKLPLLRWREGARFIASTHTLAPMRMVAEQPSGVLLHVKFLQDFHARAVDAVERNAHWDGSREYRRYLKVVKRDPGFTLHGPDSLRYAGTEQLVALGLMRDTPGWMAARARITAETTA